MNAQIRVSLILVISSLALTGCGVADFFKQDSKAWLSNNERRIEPLKPKQVPPRPYDQPILTRLAATPPLRFYEYTENKLISLTWNLSDWDRAILDGDIQRTLNATSDEEFLWKSQQTPKKTAILKAGNHYMLNRQEKVRRLHILSKTPKSISPVFGQWRSWKGALLRSAPTYNPDKVIGRLAPATKTRIIGEVLSLKSDRWMLIAHEGIGIGYVPADELEPATKKLSALPGAAPNFYKPVNLDFAPTIVDRVQAAVLCREFVIAGIKADACKGMDGRWRAI